MISAVLQILEVMKRRKGETMTDNLKRIIANIGKVTNIVGALASLTGRSLNEREKQQVSTMLYRYSDIVTDITEDIAEINTFFNHEED